MALIVEDGTGKSDADALDSLAAHDAHFAAFGGGWDGTNAVKEQAIRRGTSWLSSYFRWHGKRTHGRAQALALPRAGLTDREGEDIPDDVVPVEVKRALYVASLFELLNPGALVPVFTAGEQIKRVKADVVEVEFRDPKFPALDQIEDARPMLAEVEDHLRGLVFSRLLESRVTVV